MLGHVDGVGQVVSIESDGEWVTMWFSVPEHLTRQMVAKGSITVDGVSLTLVDVAAERFSIALIPHTLQVTTLGEKQPGDGVNLETDIIGKYMDKMLSNINPNNRIHNPFKPACSMSEAERQTLSHLRQLFDARGIKPRKILGQNFLIDLNLVEYIVEEARLTPDDVVLEIGTGTGSMTALLADEAGVVISVEVDPIMHQLAGDATAMFDNVTLLHCDALKNKNHFAPEVLATIEEKLNEQPGRVLKLIANLPYVIATPVVSNLVKTNLPWKSIIVTIQWELAQKMGARPGSADYGTVGLAAIAVPGENLKTFTAASFLAAAQSGSRQSCNCCPDQQRRKQTHQRDRDFFHDFVRRLFHHRRKLMRSVLTGMYRKQLSKPDVDTILAVISILT